MYWELKNGSDLLECEAWIIVDASIIQRIYIYIYMPEGCMQDIKKWMEMKLFCSGCRALWGRTDPGRRVPQHRKLLGVHSVYEGKPNQDQLSEESKEITFWLANEKLCRRSNMHLAVMRQTENVLRLKTIEIFGHYLSLKVNIVHKCTNNENKDYLIIEFITVFERYWSTSGKTGTVLQWIHVYEYFKKMYINYQLLRLKVRVKNIWRSLYPLFDKNT